MTDSRQLPARERHPVLFGFLLALCFILPAGVLFYIARPKPSFRTSVSVQNAANHPIHVVVLGKAGPSCEMTFSEIQRREHGVTLKPGQSTIVATSAAHAMELVRGSIVVVAVVDPESRRVRSSIVIDVAEALKSRSSINLPYVFDGQGFVLDATADR